MDFATQLRTTAFPLGQSHFQHSLWALAVHPTEAEFVTGGEDQTLRGWSLREHRQLCMIKTECMIRSVCYSSDGAHIAVGLGGEPKRGQKKVPGPIGQFKILERKIAEDTGELSLHVVFEERHSKQTVYALR